MNETSWHCRGCGSSAGNVLLDMGRLPLANAFVRNESATDDRFLAPLALVMCDDCRLIQIRDEVPREQLFRTYLWVTGTSQAAATHAAWLAERLRARHQRGPDTFLVEVASNDGFFMERFREVGFDVLGVDPSDIGQEANARGLPTLREFFGVAVSQRVQQERGPADVIVARNVLGHASALQDLVAGFANLLAPHGVLLVEVPYAYFLRAELQYDTVFHEHLSYITVGSMANLLQRVGLKITDITFVQMNGGSLLCEAVHEHRDLPRADQVMLDFEDITQLNLLDGWRRFATEVGAQRTAFRSLLEELKAKGHRVVGYGAAAKFMTMLNYCQVTPDLLALMGDANPRKQGLLCPGVRIPVVSPQELMAYDPEYIMIGAWNLKDEIMQSFRESLGFRGQFIIPLPTPGAVG